MSYPFYHQTIRFDLSSYIDRPYELWQLVLSTGNGVNGFTLDPSLGEFILTHPNIKVNDKNAAVLSFPG